MRKESSVLVPVFIKDNELYILFTKRSFDVLHHKGQISFPGGAVSEADNSPLETALRESWEEIGIAPEDVKIIGRLDDALTVSSNFLIRPFVGLIPYPYKFTINPNEIIELVEVPVKSLMNKMNFKAEYQEHENEEIKVYFYKYKGKVIWGATAFILKQLLDEIEPFCGARD
jgi:8-oxo-dGTP pyrophosphatase MutT (NUDIX family)